MTQASSQELSVELLDSIALGSARGGKKATLPLTIDQIRPLTPDDIPLLLAPPPILNPTRGPLQLRHSHHQLARLIASGSEMTEVSLITGYSLSYISVIKGDPAFKELLSYYDKQREMIFVDVVERMRSLGLNTLEELAARLENEPESWSRRELMEMAELMLLKPLTAAAQARSGGGVPGAPITLNVTFEGTNQTQIIEAPPKPRLHQGEFTDAEQVA